MRSFRSLRGMSWKPRFTIGGLMITIVVIAIVLAALRPLASVAGGAYPALAQTIREFSTPETAVMLSCLATGAYVTLKLMSLDEKT